MANPVLTACLGYKVEKAKKSTCEPVTSAEPAILFFSSMLQTRIGSEASRFQKADLVFEVLSCSFRTRCLTRGANDRSAN